MCTITAAFPTAADWAWCGVQVHAANKPIDRSNDDRVLHRIAELAVGYSGAELANLLNEAAILAVSRDTLASTLSIIA